MVWDVTGTLAWVKFKDFAYSDWVALDGECWIGSIPSATCEIVLCILRFSICMLSSDWLSLEVIVWLYWFIIGYLDTVLASASALAALSASIFSAVAYKASNSVGFFFTSGCFGGATCVYKFLELSLEMATCYSRSINFSFIISSSTSNADGARDNSSWGTSFGKISIC